MFLKAYNFKLIIFCLAIRFLKTNKIRKHSCGTKYLGTKFRTVYEINEIEVILSIIARKWTSQSFWRIANRFITINHKHLPDLSIIIYQKIKFKNYYFFFNEKVLTILPNRTHPDDISFNRYNDNFTTDFYSQSFGLLSQNIH